MPITSPGSHAGRDRCTGGRGQGWWSSWADTQPPSPLPTGYSISSFLQMLHPECKELPEPNLLPGQLSHGAVGVKEGRVQWISMAFESVGELHVAQKTPYLGHPSSPLVPSVPAQIRA